MEYYTYDDKIIFTALFNKNISNKESLDKISEYNELIFANYKIEKIEKKNFEKMWKKYFGVYLEEDYKQKLYYDNNLKNYKKSFISKKNYYNTEFYCINKFNKKINNLPSLYRVVLGNNFNKKINKLSQVCILELGGCFEKSVNYLPSSIHKLNMNNCVSQKYLKIQNDNFPNSMNELKIGRNMKIKKFNFKLRKFKISSFSKENKKRKNTLLKNNIKEMFIKFSDHDFNIDYSLGSVKKLTVNHTFGNNSVLKISNYSNLEELVFCPRWNCKINITSESIKKITLGCGCYDRIVALPKSLKVLVLCCHLICGEKIIKSKLSKDTKIEYTDYCHFCYGIENF